jgi:hypothetical protein
VKVNSDQEEEKLLVSKLSDNIRGITQTYWKNQCPECGNTLSIAFCEECEQDLSEPSVWIGLVEIALDNFS